jgi:hypothetical protein
MSTPEMLMENATTSESSVGSSQEDVDRFLKRMEMEKVGAEMGWADIRRCIYCNSD